MEPRDAGAAIPPKEGQPPQPAQQQNGEGPDTSAYRYGNLPPNPAYEEFQREYAARYAPYSEPVVSRRRKGFRAIHMALIFTLGAAAGLGGAWWADSSGQHPTAASPVPGIVSSKPALPPYEELIRRDNGQGARGIRSSELPYDGKPPGESEQTASAPLVAPLSSAAISSGGSGEEEGVASAQPAIPPASVSVPEQARKSSPSPATPKEAAASANRAPGLGEMRSKESENKAAAPAPATSKRTTVAKNAKDQEIERMRRQADEELKKKNSASRRADDDGRNASRVAQKSQANTQPANSSSSSSNSHKVMLAQCEAAPNIFRREQCKWKLCNGMWGKNGCPSYAKPNNLYNY